MSSHFTVPQWENFFAERTKWIKSSIIRELLKFTQQPEVISFAGGLPAPELFPIDAIKKASTELLEKDGQKMLQYGPTEGYPFLNEQIAKYMGKMGVQCTPQEILPTSGSQQALDLIGKIFINEGDLVFVSKPTYLGALQAFNSYGPKYVGSVMDDDGLIPEEVEKVLKEHRPKFMYVISTFHNPAGVTIPEDRRKKLVELAEKYDTFIVEDDPYSRLRFEGSNIPPLAAYSRERVIYLGTFSKVLAPGFRLGWIVAPKEVIAKLVQAKQGTDLHTSTYVQYLAAHLCAQDLIDSHLDKIREVYKRRRDIMLDAMDRHFPKEGFHWTRPQGGLFLWVIMPEKIDSVKLLEKAVERKVAFVPGNAFYPDPEEGKNTMRLNFSNMRDDLIVEGIKRLGELLKEES
uniref:PLP-dependent aminotransferase family protein n=1 Tax=candidate division WOR-3 bacterium TaxID=2052148 RepID=A0A7C2K5L2_UNCW3